MNALAGTELQDAREAAQEKIRSLRSRKSELDQDSLDLILTTARSNYAWQDKQVSREVLAELYRITSQGPTSMNTCPARFVFVTSAEGKERIAGSLKPANVAKMKGAPVTVIVAHETEFWRKLPYLFPHEPRQHLFEGKVQHSETTAFRNGTLQGAYLMIAARALGLDVGAMSGFSNATIDEEFFAGTTVKSNFLCNIGYADESALFQKLPRLSFDDACSFE